MSLLIEEGQLEVRRSAAHGPLSPLAASLSADLSGVLAAGTHIPTEKALLSRDGGRCARDGTMLDFDPYSPSEHRCPACGAGYRGERHDRWWVMGYQLWLAERAVHGALLHVLLGDDRHARLATSILDGYAELYLGYPNRDNVLGPSRPFFSTYLESIWLLQLCVALDLLESARSAATVSARVRERVIEPSSELIASYDEGSSNRQVWNNAAILAANLLLDRRDRAAPAVGGPAGLIAHLEKGLLHDGTWYEGENYHLFAHRGLWYGVTIAERAGWELPPSLVRRFEEGFATPIATALPDFTFPSRRDSQYRVSLRQWRFAESCELGLGRRDDPRLRGALWVLYESPAPIGTSNRWRSTAEAERNEPPQALSRADLGWRSLLLARESLPPLSPVAPRSVVLEGQGFAVLRREGGRVYSALDYGHPGGGHGHPDRLNLLLSIGDERWLDDVGTGSYVDRTLHWYRSTLAHNAPLVDGRSQRPAAGVLRAFEERGGTGWVEAAVPLPGIAPAVTVTRTLVAMPDYVIDRLEWTAEREVQLALPIHVEGDVEGVGPFQSADFAGGGAPEDGFGFVHDTSVARAQADAVARLSLRRQAPGLAWLTSRLPLEWWRVMGPGSPHDGGRERQFFLVRATARQGVIATVWCWTKAVLDVAARGDVLALSTLEGGIQEHSRQESGWHVDLVAGSARSSIDLGGLRDSAASVEAAGDAVAAPPPRCIASGERAEFVLAEGAYRRSEESWREVGSPEATIAVSVHQASLAIDIIVRKDHVTFRDEGATDPALDNEHPDIHSDGVQLYVSAASWESPAGWLAVPVPASSRMRVRKIPGSHDDVPLDASWRLLPAGYAIRLSVPLAALGTASELPVALNVVVNDMAPGRARRRGQLALSGGGGFVYLRGDREPPSSLMPFVLMRG
ncbi:MAG TPA: heparinase II/III family protein [Gemmatimonadaceae bacterium]|nr:heparinase II/III family protein [Gemmatimonadaceae bacterium]